MLGKHGGMNWILNSMSSLRHVELASMYPDMATSVGWLPMP